MNAYIYRADIYCESCVEKIKAAIDADRHSRGYVAPLYEREDSDRYPQGPYANGGGESDSPQHCGKCGDFLENPLTSQGQLYLTEMLTEVSDVDEPQRTWCAFYERDPEAPYFDKWGNFRGEFPDECVEDCTAQGDVFEAAEYWRKRLNFRVPRERAVDYLAEEGAWDDLETWDDDRLARTVLWLACVDTKDEWYKARRSVKPADWAWPGLIR